MRTVSVYPPEAMLRLQRLFAGLSELEPVRFQAVPEIGSSSGEALLLLNAPISQVEKALASYSRVFAFASPCVGLEGCQDVPVRFGFSSILDPVLRGQQLHDNAITSTLHAADCPTTALALKGSNPVWVRMAFKRGTADLVAYSPPDIGDSDFLFHFLRRGRFMQILPLVHFLRDIVGTSRFQRPPLRACFMFDDPNIHWSSFGHIAYASLAESARRHNYHVTLATIPLDTWFVHQPTAQLFRDNRERLSFLVHGNDHTKAELARSRKEGVCRQVAAQALRRIDCFERRSNLEVARVMAAPHGACNKEMAAALLQVGFEAACISRGSIMSCNPDCKWSEAVGLNLAEFLGERLPVIHRFPLERDRKTDIILAAFLGQAIIPAGHHQDLSDGYGLLEELADFINRIGPVHWMNPRELARSNFLQRASGTTLRVRTFARRFRLEIPEDVSKVEVEHTWRLDGRAAESVVVERNGRTDTTTLEGRTLEIAVDDPGPFEICYRNPVQIDFRSVASPPPSAWPLVRRALAEGRDRVKPLLTKKASFLRSVTENHDGSHETSGVCSSDEKNAPKNVPAIPTERGSALSCVREWKRTSMLDGV